MGQIQERHEVGNWASGGMRRSNPVTGEAARCGEAIYAHLHVVSGCEDIKGSRDRNYLD